MTIRGVLMKHTNAIVCLENGQNHTLTLTFNFFGLAYDKKVKLKHIRILYLCSIQVYKKDFLVDPSLRYSSSFSRTPCIYQ